MHDASLALRNWLLVRRLGPSDKVHHASASCIPAALLSFRFDLTCTPLCVCWWLACPEIRSIRAAWSRNTRMGRQLDRSCPHPRSAPCSVPHCSVRCNLCQTCLGLCIHIHVRLSASMWPVHAPWCCVPKLFVLLKSDGQCGSC